CSEQRSLENRRQRCSRTVPQAAGWLRAGTRRGSRSPACGVPCRKPRTNIISGCDIVRIGYQRVVGGSDFLAQPCVDRLVASEERTQAVADDLTLAGVSTRSHPLTQSIGHLVGKRDAQLPCRPHDQPPNFDRTPSYSCPVLDAQCQWEALALVCRVSSAAETWERS